MIIPESVRALVATGPLAHLTTLNTDGSPQVTVVWVAIEGDDLVSAHLHLQVPSGVGADADLPILGRHSE